MKLNIELDEDLIKRVPDMSVYSLAGWIYHLLDPETRQVCYVGKSLENPFVRLINHKLANQSNPEMTQWLKSVNPIMLIVDLCFRDDIDEVEQAWISKSIISGDKLLNKLKPRSSQQHIMTQAYFSTAHQFPVKQSVKSRIYPETDEFGIKEDIYSYMN